LKTRLLTLLVTLPLLLAAVSCNEQAPSNRPFFAAGQTNDDDDDDEPVEDIVRPTGVITFKDDFCGCKDNASILVTSTDCTNFCATKNTGGQELLYVNFNVAPSVELDPGLKDTRGWCSNDYGIHINPSCVIQPRYVQNGTSVQGKDIEVTILQSAPNSTSFDITALPSNTTVLLTMKELSSEASSNSIQILKKSAGTGETGGVLPLQPVSEYACVIRGTSGINNTTFFSAAARQHFYFTEKARPEPIPQGSPQFICHDMIKEGTTIDDQQFPRLDQRNAFTLWDTSDVRFADLNADGTPDIDTLIKTKLQALGSTLASNTRFFGELQITGLQVIQAGNAPQAAVGLGLYMRSFVDNTTNLPVAYCPKQAHYNSSQKLFNVLGDLIQVDTEGIYMARRQAMTYNYTDPNTQQTSVRCMSDDFLLVRESMMKQVWFYYQNNGTIARATTDSQLRNNTIYFYYPFNPANPLVRQSHQKMYRVILPAEAATPSSCSTGNSTSGVPQNNASVQPYPATNIQPHDKRFGCIPVTTGN
jgi:hypothetical protein